MVTCSKELGQGALGLCDRDGLYGVVRAFARAQEIGHRLIVGAELSLAAPGVVIDRSDGARPSRRGRRANQNEGEHRVLPDAPTVVLLARDHVGYSNLCRLLTHAHAGLPKGESLLEMDSLLSHHEGLVAVVPGPRIPRGKDTPPDELFSVLTDAFGPERAFVAAFLRRDGHDSERLETVERWSSRYRFDVVASTRPLYHEQARKPLADVLHCIRTGTTLDRAGLALDGNTEAVLRSEHQMLELFRERPSWVTRAGELALELTFSLEQIKYDFPCELGAFASANDALRHLVGEGLLRRYPKGVPTSVEVQVKRSSGSSRSSTSRRIF